MAKISGIGGSRVAALTTGPAPAAIGVIEVSGPGSLHAVAACFHTKRDAPRPSTRLSSRLDAGSLRASSTLDAPPSTPDALDTAFPPGTLILGTLHDDNIPLDEAFLIYRPPPDAWTGEELVELHCHGGPVLLDAVLAALEKRGVRRGTAADLAARAVRNGKIDRIQAEALECLAQARTPLAARVYLDQLNGRLSQFLRELPSLPPGQLAEKLDSLLSTAPFGLALSNPPVVVLAGPPNAGKSSLFNALVGADRAIVHDAPGTTRDPVDDLVAPGGIPIRLVDTAGVGGPSGADSRVCVGGDFRLRPGESDGGTDPGPSPAERAPTRVGGDSVADGHALHDIEIDRAAEAATLRALAEADAILWVVDATRPVPEALRSLAATHATPSAWVFNKMDLLQPFDSGRHPPPLAQGKPPHIENPLQLGTGNKEPGTTLAYYVSALTGQGVPELSSALPRLIGLTNVPLPDAPCIFMKRQRDALEAARRALPDAAAAGQPLSALLAPDDPGCFR